MNTKLTPAVAVLTPCAAPAFRTGSEALTWLIAMSASAMLAVPMPVAARGGPQPTQGHHHYKLVDLGTFGGPNADYESDPPEIIINASGVVAGFAETPASDPYCVWNCYVVRAFEWHNGVRTALDSLASGINSFAYSINNRGQTVGESENGNVDPLTGYPEFIAVLWNMSPSPSPLGTLGGNQSAANAINDRGLVVGAALNAIPDPLSNAFSLPYLFVPAATQAHAFRWTVAEGMQDLGTLGGPDSTAAFVNKHGQIAGQSYTNSTVNPMTSLPTQDPFFWEHGEMADLGTLGGTFGIATGMNDSGQVIGVSNIAGDQTHHAFLWDKQNGMKDLGTLSDYSDSSVPHWINDAGEIVGESVSASGTGSRAFQWKAGVLVDLGTIANDACSVAMSINSRSQIVGFGSADCNHEDHAFLSENGSPPVDLVTLAVPRPAMIFKQAIFINDRGEIAVRGALPNGDQHALVLLPCDEDHPGVEGCNYSLEE